MKRLPPPVALTWTSRISPTNSECFTHQNVTSEHRPSVRHDYFFGISNTTPPPYRLRNSSALAVWNDSVASSGKAPERTSPR